MPEIETTNAPEVVEEMPVTTVPAEEAAPTATATATTATAAAPETGRGARGAGGPGGRGARGAGRGRERAPRERSEFDQSTLEVRRVARVMAGGRRFSFSVTIVIGDKKGRVGVGLGKGADTALAIDKAVRSAKKALITVPLTKTRSIEHSVEATNGSSTIQIIPSAGRGLVAGSAMRTVLEYAGVTDVITKIQTRSKNKLTIARATIDALKMLQTR
jgi:small subunit ribosomal protein S5